MLNEKNERPDKRKDHPPEKPKKLPAAIPEKFDFEQSEAAGKMKRGKGARLHGSR